MYFPSITFLSPLIVIGLIALVAYLSQLNKDKERTISILDNSGYLTDVFQNTENTTYNYLTNVDLQSAITLVKEKEDYGLLYVGEALSSDGMPIQFKFYSEDSPSITVISSIESKIERHLRELKLQAEGVSLDQIQSSKTQINISQESFEGEKSSKLDNIVKLAFGGMAGYLLFMFIII